MASWVTESTRQVYPGLLEDTLFWNHFVSSVRGVRTAWRHDFSNDALLLNNDEDLKMYGSNPTASKFQDRRDRAYQLRLDAGNWPDTVLSCCEEIVRGTKGRFTDLFRNCHLYNTLEDFVMHLYYFQVVSRLMFQKGEMVSVFGFRNSAVHDVDKLDPVLLTGYAEKFDDGMDTLLWKTGVQAHVTSNVHHQAHFLWHALEETSSSPEDRDFLQDLRLRSLREMVCDKVSRKLQKELGGVLRPEMWEVDPAFYKGLPDFWTETASDLADLMKLNQSV